MLANVRKVVRFIYKNCNRLLVSSRGFDKSIQETGGYVGEIDYFPNWVEPQYFTPLQQLHGTDLPKLPKGFLIMFAGNIGAAQDFDTIIKAADILKDKKDIHWVILGDGRRAEWAREQVRIKNLDNNFHMLGRFPSETMPEFFAQADALLVTLKREPIFALTVPGKVQSYMACGKPVLAAIDGEGAQIIDQAGAGLTCPAENPDMLSERILELYDMSPLERQTMGLRGRDYSLEHFNRETLFTKLESEMSKVISQKKNI
jgi:glycosyltransferase involved in cell wall biosynthesis